MHDIRCIWNLVGGCPISGLFLRECSVFLFVWNLEIPGAPEAGELSEFSRIVVGKGGNLQKDAHSQESFLREKSKKMSSDQELEFNNNAAYPEIPTGIFLMRHQITSL